MPIVEIKGEIENIMVRIRIKDKKIGKHVIRPDNLIFYRKFLKYLNNIVTIYNQ